MADVPERIWIDTDGVTKAMQNGVGSYYVRPSPDDASNRDAEYVRVHGEGETLDQLPCGHSTFTSNKDGIHYCKQFPNGVSVVGEGDAISREAAVRVLEQAAMLADPNGVIPEGDPEYSRLASLCNTFKSAVEVLRALPSLPSQAKEMKQAEPLLGLATTTQLLDEIKARVRMRDGCDNPTVELD